MAIVCRSYGLIYLMAPRTACTALGEALQAKLSGELVPEKDILDENGNFLVHRKHHSLREMSRLQLLPEADIQSFFKFTCIRNPFDSLVSDYVKRATKYQHFIQNSESWVHRLPSYIEDMEFCTQHSFDEWIEKHYAGLYGSRFHRFKQNLLKNSSRNRLKKWLGVPVRPYTMYGDYTRDVDYVMRFEKLQQDFDFVLEQAEVPCKVTIPVVNQTDERSKNYRDYYSDRSRAIVEYVFQHELKQFNYSF